MERSLVRSLLGVALLALGACGAAEDGAGDTAPDAEDTTVADEGTDTPGDTADTSADLPSDAGADADASGETEAGADAGDGTDPDVGPATCGPFPGGDCPTAEVCDVRSCGMGAGGVCVPRPTGCDDVWAPVCGCDGVTYGNDCDRLMAGVALEHLGACGSGSICGTIAGFACPTGEICDIRECFPDAAGTCVPRPGGCPDLWAPVCGCDGVTYGNDCDRLAAGAALDHAGECDVPCKPECRTDPSGTTAWFDPCTSELICEARCTTCSAACEAVGSRSEGWYAVCTDTTVEGGCAGSSGLGRLIAWDFCGS